MTCPAIKRTPISLLVHLSSPRLPFTPILSVMPSVAFPDINPPSAKFHTRQGRPSLIQQAQAKYDLITSEPSETITDASPRKPPPLLILDLNGALLFRPKWVPGGKPSPPVIRPHLKSFCDYIFGTHEIDGKKYQNWEVMIWSSAQSKNVGRMCEALGIEKRNVPLNFKATGRCSAFEVEDLSITFEKTMSIKEHKQPVNRKVMEIWDRSMMNLSPEDFNQKVQTTKDLDQIWSQLRWNDPYGGNQEAWGPRNTVIIDDSCDKLSLQPFNLCEIKEYTGQPDDDALLKMIETLKRIRRESNIASFLKNAGLEKVSDEKVSDEKARDEDRTKKKVEDKLLDA